MSNKRVRDLCRVVESLGLKVVSVSVSGGSHYKVKISNGSKERVSFAAFSPGDTRSVLNWKSDLKKSFFTN